jgi:hypothetical protein
MFEGWMLNTFKGVKVFPVCGTSDIGKKKAKVKALSRSRVGIVHPANSKSSLPVGPPRVFLVILPYHLGRIVLVEKIKDFTTFWLISIGHEPSSKCGGTFCIGIDSLLYVASCIRVKGNPLLVGEMNLKADNIGNLLLHMEEIETPQSLTAANIACIQILLDLILAPAKLHGSPVMALVYIFIDILDCFDRGN